jgi:hypothetical protein
MKQMEQTFLTDIGFHNPIPYDVRMGKIKHKQEEDNMAERKMKEIKSALVKFEKFGDKVEGIYRGTKVAGNFGNDAYAVETKDGEVTIFGTAVLSRKMKEVAVGKYVIITYIDDIPNGKKGQNPIKDFKVQVEE